jgi:hypothetical protein
MSRLSTSISAILWIARYYGLYSSRMKGKANKDGNLVKFGYNPAPAHERAQNKDSNTEMETVSSKASRQSWARLIQKVYEVDPWSLQSKLPGSFGECQNYTGCAQNATIP